MPDEDKTFSGSFCTNGTEYIDGIYFSTYAAHILQAFFNARRSFSVNIQISRLETSELSLTHQLENNLTIGRTRKAVGKPTPPRRLGCRLVFRKHFSIFRSSTRVFSIYTVILKWKTFSISQTNT